MDRKAVSPGNNSQIKLGIGIALNGQYFRPLRLRLSPQGDPVIAKAETPDSVPIGTGDMPYQFVVGRIGRKTQDIFDQH